MQPLPLTGLPQRLWELSLSPARQEEGLRQRCPGTAEETTFPWGSFWGSSWLSGSQGCFPQAVTMPSRAGRVGDNG